MTIVSGIEPSSGRTAEVELPGSEDEFSQSIDNLEMPDGMVKRTIDNLDISADAKVLLYKLSRTTIVLGEHVVRIGRKILDFTCTLLAEFPNTTFGLALGGVAGALFSAIPGLGQLLGPIVAPILIFLGFLGGVFFDFKERMINQKIARYVAEQHTKLSQQIDRKIRELSEEE